MGDIAKRLREEAKRRDQLQRPNHGDIIDYGAYGLRVAADLVEKWEAERAMTNREAYERGLATALGIVRELAAVVDSAAANGVTGTGMCMRLSERQAMRRAAQHIADAHITHPWQAEEDGR